MATFEEGRRQETEAKINVKEGDAWFRLSRFGNPEEVTVIKVTKTQLTFSNGVRVMRSTGEPIGNASSLSGEHYRPATPALRYDLDEIRQKKESTRSAQDAITRLTAEEGILTVAQKLRLVELVNEFLVSVREENIKESRKS